MRKLNLLAAPVLLLAGLVAAPAHAADPIDRVPAAVPMAPPIVFNWTGFYVGLNAGGAFSHNRTTTSGTDALTGFAVPAGVIANPGATGRDGFTGGLQLGYNVQFNQLVLGLEADLNLMPGRETNTAFGPVVPAGTVVPILGATPAALQFQTTASHRLDYLSTVRARVGFAADRFLIYGTGGLAFGNVRTTGTLTAFTPAAGGATAALWSGSSNETRLGWTIGGGAEYAVSNNITIRAEYMYYDLGKTSLRTPLVSAAAGLAGALAPTAIAQDYTTRRSIARVGVNFRF